MWGYDPGVWILVAFCSLMAGISGYYAIAGRKRTDVWPLALICFLGYVGFIAGALWFFRE